MRISEKRYKKIYEELDSVQGSFDKEMRRRGYTIKRKSCGCMQATREVIGMGASTVSEWCREHGVLREAVPVRIRFEDPNRLADSK